MGAAMEIRVLGPMTLARIDDPSGATAVGPTQRRMLAALCVHAGQVVASDRLADMLGLKSNGAVRTTVHRLRNVTGDLIRHQPPGYVVQPESLDSYRFLARLSEARQADQHLAVGLYDAALSLWHGPAYDEFAAEEWALAEATRLDELRTTARAERIDALLLSGKIADAAADAEQLIRDEPLRENPRALLMQALALQGRQTEALRSYQEYRTYLADEAGVDPSDELAELEGQILSGAISPTSKKVASPDRSPSAPTGTVTFLFTDIEGSTALWESAPADMNDELAEHDRQLRSCVDENGGWVFAHTGDGIGAAFSSATAAITTAIEAQQRLKLPVRMGIATGEAKTRDGNYFGTVVNRTTRIMGAGHVGQILVASTTALMVDDIELLDLGNHRLRDLPELMGIYQVQADGLQSEFPPLNTETRDSGNLPAITHELHGRTKEIQALNQLLHTQRLVTLTGSGGVGKTSLALHVANNLAHEFPDGVWWIELAPIQDASGVPDAVAAVLGVTPRADAMLSESIADSLVDRRMLIVLDNCEHVLDAAADLASLMLRSSQQLAIVATSREHLRIAGERVWTVAPLDATGSESPAVQLFLQRARAVATDVDVAADIDAVIEVCKSLDGVAFAIELAAARMVSMSSTDIRDRLDDRFRLLAGPRRGLKHQQTLRQAVQWSYDLLDDDERELLNRLSVFVGGFDLVSAHLVAADNDHDEFMVMDLIESLVRKSLLTTERVLGRVRYGMLETIRDFAQSELSDGGQATAIRERHAAYFAENVKTEWGRWSGPAQQQAIDWVEAELANLRAAFRFATDAGDLATASTIAGHTAILGRVLQQYEPVSWAEEIIDHAIVADVKDLPVLFAGVALAAVAGRPEVTLRYGKLAADLELRDDVDLNAVTWGRHFTAIGYRYSSKIDRWFELSAELASDEGLAQVLGSFGMLTVPSSLDGAEQIRSLGEEAVALARELDNAYLIASILSAYGRSLALVDIEEALAVLQESYAMARAGKMRYLEAAVAREIAGIEAIHGQSERSLDHFATALDSFQSGGDRASAAMVLGALSAVLNRMNRPEPAATVYGCCVRFASSRSAYLPSGLELPQPDPNDEVLAAAKMQGEAMTFNEAIGFAQGEIEAARADLVAANAP